MNNNEPLQRADLLVNLQLPARGGAEFGQIMVRQVQTTSLRISRVILMALKYRETEPGLMIFIALRKDCRQMGYYCLTKFSVVYYVRLFFL